MTDVWGREYSLTTRNLVASNGLIHRDLLHELVQAEMCDRGMSPTGTAVVAAAVSMGIALGDKDI